MDKQGTWLVGDGQELCLALGGSGEWFLAGAWELGLFCVRR